METVSTHAGHWIASDASFLDARTTRAQREVDAGTWMRRREEALSRDYRNNEQSNSGSGT